MTRRNELVLRPVETPSSTLCFCRLSEARLISSNSLLSGRSPAACLLHPPWHGDFLTDPAKTGQLPATKWPSLGFARIRPNRTHALYTGWLLDKDLRQRVTAGLNKGELKNTLAKAVCFNRLGELRDRSFEAQRHRASGLNLVVAAIILWNTVYLERAIGALRQQGRQIDEGLLKHVAPVHWNHINLTGDYSWRQNKRVEKGGFRPLRIPSQ